MRTCCSPTRNAAATTARLTRANRSAAFSRIRSRSNCPFGVSPPTCAYFIHWSYRRDQGTSATHGRHTLNLSKQRIQAGRLNKARRGESARATSRLQEFSAKLSPYPREARVTEFRDRLSALPTRV